MRTYHHNEPLHLNIASISTKKCTGRRRVPKSTARPSSSRNFQLSFLLFSLFSSFRLFIWSSAVGLQSSQKENQEEIFKRARTTWQWRRGLFAKFVSLLTKLRSTRTKFRLDLTHSGFIKDLERLRSESEARGHLELSTNSH